MPRIHLVSYATPRFRLRQIFLGWSAIANGVADTVTSWDSAKLLAAGFETRAPGIRLDERGSGFWAWKPFIIDAKLREIPDDDLVFYCDVGRLYPFKLLDQPLSGFLRWMDERRQEVMPGVEIPWSGPNSAWTKREALVATGMDRPEVHRASPIQASFSIWRAGDVARSLAGQWLEWCSQRSLVSDDPGRSGLEELPGFRAHRHDQALLTLCCIDRGIAGLSLGDTAPPINTQDPSLVSRLKFGEIPGTPLPAGRLLRAVVWPIERIEDRIRRRVKFNEPIHE